MLYKIKLIKEDVPVTNKKKDEAVLRDLLSVMPALRKHKLDGEVLSKVRKLRDGRRQRHYTLELSRKCFNFADIPVETASRSYHFPKLAKAAGRADPMVQVEEVVKRQPKSTELKVSAALTKSVNKTQLLSSLKEQIIAQIKDIRKKQKPVIENYRFREGVEVKKLAEVYLEPGAFIKVADKRVRLNMNKGKVPKTDDRYVGVELEFASREDQEHVADLLFAAGVGKHVCVKRDGSIKVDDQFPHAVEVTILMKENEVVDVMERICKVLNEQMHIRVDKSCGLHVHLDMRKRDVARSFANLITMQHFLYAMVPANRKTGKYSVPMKDRTFPVAEGRVGGREQHYDGVSSYPFARQRTLEMRMHCGTSRAKKVINWVQLLIAIADAPLIEQAPTSIKAAQPLLGISDDLVTYAESRIAKFAAQHKKAAGPDWMTKVDPVATLPDTASMEEQSEVA